MFSELQVGPARSELLEFLSALRAIRDFRRGDGQVRNAFASVSGSAILRAPLLFKQHRYTRTLVYRTPAVEVLLLAWDGGVASPVHDHAGQQCWFMPLSGTFMIEDYAQIGPVSAEARGNRVLEPGEIDQADPERALHRVRAHNGPAVSLHVYAKPIDSCLVFDVPRGRIARKALTYDAIARLR